MSRRVLPILLLVLSAIPEAATAQWIEGGVPVARGNNQLFGQVPDGAGGSILAWSAWQGAYDFDIRAQRVLATGKLDPAWPVEDVRVCSAEGAQLFPSATPDGSGGAFVLWLDNRGRDWFTPAYGVYAHHVEAGGSLASGWPLNGLPVCPDSCTDVEPTVAVDGTGGAYIGWSERGPDGNVRLQRITRDGGTAPGWPTQGVLVCGAPNVQVIRDALPDGAGGVYVSWDDFRAGYPEAYVQRITAEGTVTAGWPLEGRRFSDGSVPVGSTMCSDGAGGLIAFWREGRPGNGFIWRMRSKRIASDGSESAGWISPEVSIWVYSSEETPTCVATEGGDAYVAWTYAQSSAHYPTYAQRVLANGASAPGWPEEGIPISGGDYNFRPQIASDGAGGAYFVWEHVVSGPTEVLIQHLLPDGAIASGWLPGGRSLTPETPNSAFPAIIPSDGGACIVAWETFGGTQDGIFAQRVSQSGVDYFAFSIIATKADPDRARLTWQASSSWDGPVTVYRRGESGWAPLQVTTADAVGKISYEDPEVVPGAVYIYRLGATVHGAEIFYGEVQVQIPLFVLTVRSAAGNPASQGLMVSFTLPTEEAAKLELFDVQGRLLESQEVGRMGVGRHTLTFGAQNRPASGIYLVRLSQGGRTAISKVTYLR